MAWTLHLLVWITVMTASAYKYKHTSDSNSHHHYDYPSKEPTGIPDNRAYERMNTRSADISPASYSSNVPDDVKSAQLRIGEQTPTRTENESKVLSLKPYAESRRGQNTDKIIFPGPTAEEFQLEIPEHCRKLGFCEDIPNYPTEQAKIVISELSDLGMFQDNKLDLPDVPKITQRVGSQEENIELCQFEEKTVYPKTAIDSSGKWYVVLNPDEKLIQGYKVEICKNVSNIDGQTSELQIKEEKWQDLTQCSAEAEFVPEYEFRCKQKFVYRKMAVLHKRHNGSNLEKLLQVPSSCSCVGKLTDLNHW